jgi:hypothetical protein
MTEAEAKTLVREMNTCTNETYRWDRTEVCCVEAPCEECQDRLCQLLAWASQP